MKFYNTTSLNKPALWFLALLLLSTASGMAQSINSTYSRFGIGNLVEGGNIRSAGMGGIYVPSMDGGAVNLYNPASFSFLDITSFQVSGRFNNLNASTNTSSTSFSNGSVGEMALAFKKPGSKWGFGFGVHPYSSTGYYLTNSKAINDTLDATYTYEGAGGLSEASWGASRAFFIRNKRVVENKEKSRTDTIPYNHLLSFGLNVDYIFGNLKQTGQISYSSVEYFGSRTNNNVFVQGVTGQAGLQYQLPLKLHFVDKKISKSQYLQLGVVYTYGRDMRTKVTSLSESFAISATGAAQAVDTSYYVSAQRGHMSIPSRIALGLAWRKFDNKKGTILLAAQYVMQNWSDFNVTPSNSSYEYMDNYSTISLGFEYRPSTDRNSGFWKDVHYRLGVRYTDANLILNNTELTGQTMSAGISLPLLKSMSRMHLTVENGVFGTKENDLIRERNTTIWLGFTFTPREPWFFQRKYD